MNWSLLLSGVGTFAGVGSLWYAGKAARLSAPTGNGFVSNLYSALNNITGRLDRMEKRLDNLDRPAGT